MNRFTVAATALALSVSGAFAQAYPTKPITMIVPFAAGGPTDIIARIAAESFSKTLGQQVVVENIAGAGGTTGITRGAQSPADGYTIMMGHMGTHGAAPALYPNMKYNPITDFSPIGLTAGTPIIIVAKKAFPAKDLKEFIAHLKTNGDKLNEGHAGVGSVSHTTCTLLASLTGTKTGRIAYRGTGPVLNDLVGGQIDFGCDQIVSLVSQIKGGNIKAMAIATKERSPALPDVPTTAEAGLPAYEVSAWNALFAPKGTPKDVMDKLTAALDKALDDPAVKARLLELGSVLPDKAGRTPDALQKLVEKEVARWAPVLKDAVAAAKAAAPAATPAATPAPAAPAKP
jgi:tripartite-type tricarboxylate transporter receptor subunit TctC